MAEIARKKRAELLGSLKSTYSSCDAIRWLHNFERVDFTKDDAIHVAGYPDSVSKLPFGNELLQWMENGSHIAVVFDAAGKFIEISHDFKHRSTSY